MAQHEIKTIVAELQSMSPRTQLEIVRLCKKVAELTPDYIDTLSEETKELLQPLINANAAAIAQEVTDRKAIVELVGNTNKMKSNGNDTLAGVYVSDSSTGLINSNLIELAVLANLITAAGITLDSNKILIDCGNKQIKLDKSTHEITLTNNEHVLKLDASGNLTLDGAEVGGGGGVTLFQHNINITYSGSYIKMIIINNSNIQFDTPAKIATYLNSNGFNAESKSYNANGCFIQSSNAFLITGAYSTNNSIVNCKWVNFNTLANGNINISGTTAVTDTIIQIN